MAKLKVGRNILEISEDDLILDNGACYQIVTKMIGFGFNEYIPVMSKKLFKDLKIVGLIFTNDTLKKSAIEKYGDPTLSYWKFDVEKMKEMGY